MAHTAQSGPQLSNGAYCTVWPTAQQWCTLHSLALSSATLLSHCTQPSTKAAAPTPTAATAPAAPTAPAAAAAAFACAALVGVRWHRKAGRLCATGKALQGMLHFCS
jgi:hypothetical protein